LLIFLYLLTTADCMRCMWHTGLLMDKCNLSFKQKIKEVHTFVYSVNERKEKKKKNSNWKSNGLMVKFS